MRFSDPSLVPEEPAVSIATRILAKLDENPGAFLFFRGNADVDPAQERVPDSYSPEYYFLIQQKARLRFSRACMVSGKNPIAYVLLVPRLVRYWLRLQVINALVASYVNEYHLTRIMAARDENGSP